MLKSYRVMKPWQQAGAGYLSNDRNTDPRSLRSKGLDINALSSEAVFARSAALCPSKAKPASYLERLNTASQPNASEGGVWPPPL
jgi:hypothetical protein